MKTTKFSDNSTDSVNQFEPSKSQRKREMIALQELGEKLVNLKTSQLTKFNLPESLFAAVMMAKKITKHEAKRRQLQYIGRLMRSIDAAPIAQAIARLEDDRGQLTAEFQLIENWRERLLKDEKTALTTFLIENPQTDTQHLRQLIKNALKEKQTGNSKGAGRALFRYLSELLKHK